MEKFKNYFSKNAPITIIGVIGIGIIGNILYDLVIKPGLSESGRFILNTITLGSTTIRDYAYAQAAIDPTSVSSLFLLLIITALPFAFIVNKTLFKVPVIKNTLANKDSGKSTIKAIFTLMYYILPVIVLIMFLIHNQSVAIWRTFNANLNIVAPYITEKQKIELVSEFSSMESKNNYLQVDSIFQKIAKDKNLTLRDIDLW